MNSPRIILASTSRYRAELLGRILPGFEQQGSSVDETPLENEAPSLRALRLSEAKARAIAAEAPDALIIGSDQVAECEGEALGKPGDAATAKRQLQHCSGRTVVFHTGLCLIDTRSSEAPASTATDVTRVHFRTLDEASIERYIEREKPFDCAGSFKCEGLGIALFERIESIDPTGLIGLPLITLARLLRERGIAVP
ncbi:Maf family protein [Oleiagrimonas sp. C23AA]|uniref:Maf family protein n=1 Tax=Oleiagrimonas sp. C23AA TaxID=2719047 RepID=UPI0014214EFF|nr:Maf family protein [Oleiagrimonas sp. C23AA]NII10312.1 septum formation inhibitor Maf [Oleiagrimonas sp. C23AA]